MYRKCLALVAVLVLGVSAVALARSTNITVKTSGVIHANVVDITGAHGTLAGSVKDKAAGDGAIVFKGVGYGKAQKTGFTAFFAGGTLKGKTVSDNVPGSSGTATISNGKITIIGGTGIYKKASGSGTFSGSQNLTTLRAVINYKLKYSYSK